MYKESIFVDVANSPVYYRGFFYFWQVRKKLKIAIIGNGKAGNFLAGNLQLSGVDIFQYSRNGLPPSRILFDFAEDAYMFDLVLLCVSDNNIASLSEYLEPTIGIVAHVAGSAPLESISAKHQKRAVFYPLMSLNEETTIPVQEIPFLLEGENPDVEKELIEMVESMELRWQTADSAQRARVHLAAVLAQNFSNYLYQLAFEVLEDADLDFDILKPLLLNALHRIDELPPVFHQTGPAVRHDKKTIAQHLDLIKDEEVKKLYLLISGMIQKKYDEEL